MRCLSICYCTVKLIITINKSLFSYKDSLLALFLVYVCGKVWMIVVP